MHYIRNELFYLNTEPHLNTVLQIYQQQRILKQKTHFSLLPLQMLFRLKCSGLFFPYVQSLTDNQLVLFNIIRQCNCKTLKPQMHWKVELFADKNVHETRLSVGCSTFLCTCASVSMKWCGIFISIGGTGNASTSFIRLFQLVMVLMHVTGWRIRNNHCILFFSLAYQQHQQVCCR